MRYILTFLLLTINLAFSPCWAGNTKADSNMLAQDAKAYRDEGYRLQSAGDLDGALSYYQKSIEIDPMNYQVYNDIGVLYEAKGEMDKAAAMYKKTLDVNDNYLPAVTNLAFYYEGKGDYLQAQDYWKKRYELGQEGEYWREVAKQHLLALGTYPKIRKENIEKKAAALAKELVYEREQEKLKAIEEAKLHFDIGSGLFAKGDYTGAMKELTTALSVNTQDEAFRAKVKEMHIKAKRAYEKEQAIAATQEALNYIKKDDYLSAGEKLRNALSTVFGIAQEK